MAEEDTQNRGAIQIIRTHLYRENLPPTPYYPPHMTHATCIHYKWFVPPDRLAICDILLDFTHIHAY